MQYKAVTSHIEVLVTPSFLDGHSNPEDEHFVWAYDVEIVNHGASPIQILSRHWDITDSAGWIETVSAPGIGGNQPVIKAGERFAYQSAAPLETPSGIMVGHYVIRTADDHLLKIDIPAFSLDSPYEVRTQH